jgi:uncharacterized membrane protein YeaQ/YmgE (transglycosylase-associated protein family)
MHLIGAIIIGFIVGLAARFLMPGRDAMGFILTSVLGIVGAVIATYLGRAMGMYGVDEPAGFIASIVGALIVLGLYHAVAGKKSTSIADRDRWAA